MYTGRDYCRDYWITIEITEDYVTALPTYCRDYWWRLLEITVEMTYWWRSLEITWGFLKQIFEPYHLIFGAHPRHPVSRTVCVVYAYTICACVHCVCVRFVSECVHVCVRTCQVGR